ncbi:MAG: sulfatase, partial [Planctomycetota bacterium]|nr:sulfatase [Planctomycetota bacterium]
GSDFYETPNIDRLAAEGMRFTDAYATSPVCSPSRVSIMTGKLPARVRITDWIPGVRYPHAKLRTPGFRRQMELEEVTIAEALSPAGYASFHVGKWHLGGEGFWPLEQGFDVNVAGHSKGAPGSYYHPYAKKTARTDWSVINLPPGGKEGDYLTDRLTDEALELLDGVGERPFFLHMAYYTVHTPIEGKPELVEKYRAKRERHPEARHALNAGYAAMVQSLDESVGRILGKLDELGLAENTVVIFTSDNGGVEGITDNAPLRAAKGQLYEGGIRAPLIVRWPARVEPGTVSHEPVTGADLYPTVLEVAGVEREAPADGCDGVSIVPLLDDPEASLRREALYWHYPHYHTPQRPPSGAVRAGRYKLLEFYEDGRLELYDLASDVGETTNLAEEKPELAKELRSKLHAWLDSVGAQRTQPNPDHDPERPFRDATTAWRD